MKTSISKIEEILGDKIKSDKKRKLELFLINSPLDEKQKIEIIKFINEII